MSTKKSFTQGCRRKRKLVPRRCISTSFLSFFSRHFERREGEKKAASFRKIFILFSYSLCISEVALQEKEKLESSDKKFEENNNRNPKKTQKRIHGKVM